MNILDVAYYWLRGAQVQGLLKPGGDWPRLIAMLDDARKKAQAAT